MPASEGDTMTPTLSGPERNRAAAGPRTGAGAGAARPPVRHPARRLLLPAVLLGLLTAAALDTRVVRIGSTEDQRAGAFSAEAWGRKTFPAQRAAIEAAAVDAATLAAALAEDKAAAAQKYGKPGSVGPIFAVRFSGTVGELRSGIANVTGEGLPAGLALRVQTGPAINGTDVRDATGTIEFGQFTNQIEYQDAGAALNEQIKAQVLAGLDRERLSGRRVEGIGVFQLINPQAWLLTPVRLTVKDAS
jgi:predicted lipoprotein